MGPLLVVHTFLAKAKLDDRIIQTTAMNTQLVDSILQVVQALPKEEQTMLIERLNVLFTQAHLTESSTAASPDEETIDEDAWEIWRSLGDDAVPGRLENPSIHHDCYLYSKDP